MACAYRNPYSQGLPGGPDSGPPEVGPGICISELLHEQLGQGQAGCCLGSLMKMLEFQLSAFPSFIWDHRVPHSLSNLYPQQRRGVNVIPLYPT